MWYEDLCDFCCWQSHYTANTTVIRGVYLQLKDMELEVSENTDVMLSQPSSETSG